MTDSNGNDGISDNGDGVRFARYMWFGVGGFFVLVLLVFLVGIALAVFTDPQNTAPRVGIVRDTLIIIIFLEAFLIVMALAMLALQVTRLFVMLRNDSRPVLVNAKETTEIARNTMHFIRNNVARPIIAIHALFSALFTFIREIAGIRRAIRPAKPRIEGDAHDE